MPGNKIAVLVLWVVLGACVLMDGDSWLLTLGRFGDMLAAVVAEPLSRSVEIVLY